jgi:hypothetical protein
VEGIEPVIWTHALLDRLRQIGDPLLDTVDGKGGWVEVTMAAPPTDDVGLPAAARAPGLLKHWRTAEQGARPGGEDREHPYWQALAQELPAAHLFIARSLFVTYGGEVAASLLLSSLPNAYAGEAGAAVLTRTKELHSNAHRRIGETAQFVVDVLFPEHPEALDVPSAEILASRRSEQAFPVGTRGHNRARTTRLTHALIRTLVADQPEGEPWDPSASAKVPAREDTEVGVPVNQEDLLGTLGTFTVVVFEVMERLGIPWTEQAEQAYLDLWDRVAELLGIGTPEVTELLAADGIELPEAYRGALRPKTPDEARQLVELIRERSWAVPLPDRELAPFANGNGKLLVRALLDQLQDAMPRGMERLPLFAMRYLLDPRAHEILGLGGGGVLDSLMRWPSELQLTEQPVRRGYGRGVVEAGMRMAANEISRRAFLHFMRERANDETQRDFWFPVIDALSIPVERGREQPAGGGDR